MKSNTIADPNNLYDCFQPLIAPTDVLSDSNGNDGGMRRPSHSMGGKKDSVQLTSTKSPPNHMNQTSENNKHLKVIGQGSEEDFLTAREGEDKRTSSENFLTAMQTSKRESLSKSTNNEEDLAYGKRNSEKIGDFNYS